MPMPTRRSALTATPAAQIATAVLEIRTAVGWSQRELSRRSNVPQSMISRIEAGKLAQVSLATATRLLGTMGARLRLEIDAPFLGERRHQLDPAHARMSSHIARCLERTGWQVATEVEVGGDRSRGWMDLLAFHPPNGLLLVIEVKTEIHDLGQIDRTLGWYEREASAAGRRLGWQPVAIIGCLLLLMTHENEGAVAFNREGLRRLFPVRAAGLRRIVDGEEPAPTRRTRALAMVDPRSKRRVWLRPTRDEGRRTPAPYADYADFIRWTVGRPPRRPGLLRPDNGDAARHLGTLSQPVIRAEVGHRHTQIARV
jgi:transcriptional regulator with XRE-family HTH domain